MKKENIISGVTESGFEFKIPADTLDDYELMEMIAELDDGKMQNLPKIINKVLGDGQKNALMEHLRKNGKVSMIGMSKSFFEIMGAIKEGKKS